MFKLANLSLSVVLLGKYIIFDMRRIGRYGDEMDKGVVIVGLFSIILLSAAMWHYLLWMISTMSKRCVCLLKILSALSSILTILFSLILSATILVMNVDTYPGYFTLEDNTSIKADKIISRIIFVLNISLMITRNCSSEDKLVDNGTKTEMKI